MRPIHLARLDQTLPAVILTRESVLARRSRVTVVPITSSVWGLSSEVAVGQANGLEHESVINCDNIVTIAVHDLGRQVGFLHDDQEHELAEAILAAFDLDL